MTYNIGNSLGNNAIYVIVGLAILFLIIIAVLAWSCSNNSDTYKDSSCEEYSSCEYSSDEEPEQPEYDYIVCGLGSAGAIVAHNLAKEGFRVLGIEVGENRNHDPIVTEYQNIFVPGFSNEYSTTYLNEPHLESDMATYQRQVATYGNMLGGSGGVNYMVAVRPTKHYHGLLQQYAGNSAEWSYDAWLEAYKKTETYVGTTSQPSQRGDDGPISVTQLRFGTGFETWMEAMANTGPYPSMLVEDYNIGEELVVSNATQDTVRVDETGIHRSWSGPGYLDEPIEGLDIMLKTNVKRVLFNTTSELPSDLVGRVWPPLFVRGTNSLDQSSPRAVGVVVLNDDGTEHTHLCSKEVILCAGLESSCILERSGIGLKSVMDKIGVQQVAELPVGENLMNHTGPDVFVVMDPEYANSAFAIGFNAVNEDVRQIETIISSPYVFTPVTEPSPVRILMWNIDPVARGNIHVKTANLTQPIINYDTTPDIENIATFIQQTIVPTIEADPKMGAILNVSPEILSDKEKLKTWIFDVQVYAQHWMGQCSLGTVVDQHLKVNSVSGLRVCDGSIFPIPIPGNTVIGIMALAHKLTEFIVQGN